MNIQKTRCIYADKCEGFNIRTMMCFEAHELCGDYRVYEPVSRKYNEWLNSQSVGMIK